MHDDRAQVERRLERVLSQRIRPGKYADSVPLRLEAWRIPCEPVPVTKALQASYEPVGIGAAWGPPWSTTWFRAHGEIPVEWSGRRVEAVFDLGFTDAKPGFQAEALVYDSDGRPIKGIHPRNTYVPVATSAGGEEPVELLLEAAANPAIPLGEPTELGDRLTAGDAPQYRLERAELACLDEAVWHLMLDVEVLDEVMHQLSLEEPRRHEILRSIEQMLDILDPHDVAGTAPAARAELAHILSRPAHASAHRISAVGHAHIDSAWLWPTRETMRKASRTFANATKLAEEYPELIFACSQAQQYAWVKEHQPYIYTEIKQAVQTGNWVPVGSMWVESDANMPGGEALVRQIVHGKRFFLEEFEVDTEEIWLPDSFGYTAAFPQLARLAGVRWFLTQKLSWNQTNTMPHHTFWWEGIDGTRVFTHFPPVDTYNAEISAGELAHAQRTYAEKGKANRSLMPFGYGDGGGGPNREMLERARRLRDLEGSPRTIIEAPSTFFELAYEEYPDAPVWSGELYLERHRATYTTQAKTKAGNRRSEHLLREAELWAAAAALHTGACYPHDELDRLWKDVLLLQFHDILPGSSIAWVHREARESYERIRLELEGLIDEAINALGSDGGGTPSPRVLNAAPSERREVITVTPELAEGIDGGQKLSDSQVAVWASAPGMGVGTLERELPQSLAATGVAGTTLDNTLLRVAVDSDGLLASVRDLVADREVLSPDARGNLLQLHRDYPNDWDAWDIDRHYLHCYKDLTDVDSIDVVDKGPLVAAIRIRRSFGSSRITQVLRLAAGSNRLDIDTEVDWHESEKVLKAAFPVDVHADWSTAEIQFGHVHRPTHTNTSWDMARFEIWAHRWMHVAESGYGVAVANDSTYGHDVNRTTRDDGGTTTNVRLTLLRAPHIPDPRADQDVHRFSYALVPGADTILAAEAGYALNLPLRTAASNRGRMPPLVRVDNPAVGVEAIKLADDRSGDLVVRIYESQGGRASATLQAGFQVVEAKVVDLLERTLGHADRHGNAVTMSLRPFQVLTLRLAPGPATS